MKYSFKAVDENMHTAVGGGFTYQLGVWHELPEEKGTSFCHKWGFHSARNPLSCIDNFGSHGRFFIVEPGGDIDEEDTMLSSTKIRFLKEISLFDVIKYGMMYLVERPNVDSSGQVTQGEKVQATNTYCIVRGKNPYVKAPKGTIVGILKEKKDSSEIEKANLFIAGKECRANVYYNVDLKTLRE